MPRILTVVRPLSLLLAAAAALWAAAAAGCKGPDANAAKPEVVAAAPIPVEVERVATTRVAPEIAALGHLAPWRTVMVQAEAGGRVLALHAAEGDTVAEGAPLATLDRSLLDAQLHVAKSAVRQAQIAVRQAQRERDRLRRLGQSGAVASVRLDEAEDGHAQALAAHDTARARVALVEQQIEDTEVVAPFAGVVTVRHAEVGALVGPGVPLYTLQELERLKVVATFPPAALATVRAGDPARVSVPGIGLADLATRVHRVADSADPRSRRVPVEIALPRSSPALRPGLTAEVVLPIGAPKEQILVPRACVVERFDAPYAFVVEGDRAVLRRLRLGDAVGARFVVEEGLAPGDALVVTGQERLADGAKVTVVPATAPATDTDTETATETATATATEAATDTETATAPAGGE